MVAVYVNLIKNGLRTIDQVPAIIRKKVKAALEMEEKTNS